MKNYCLNEGEVVYQIIEWNACYEAYNHLKSEFSLWSGHQQALCWSCKIGTIIFMKSLFLNIQPSQGRNKFPKQRKYTW